MGEIIDVESGLEENEDDRKCVKELATGVKTRKTHDDYCPRKWKSVGKPTYASPSAGGVTPTATASVKREKESSSRTGKGK